MDGMAADFRALFERSRVWILMAKTDIAMRYRRSLLGPFWISIAMAAMVLAIGTLFSQVMQKPYQEFLTYFGCGILAWTLLSTMITESCIIVTEAEGHLRSIRIPIPVLAARMVMRNFIIFGHNALVVLTMLVLLGHHFAWANILAIPGLMAYAVIGLCAGIALGPICARFRDLSPLVANVIQILFFLTPIFWVPGSSLSRPVVIHGNPFYHLVEVVRRPLLGEAPDMLSWLAVGLIVLVSIAAAALSLAYTRRRVFLWL
jgi:ABC-type polysaccharide/polyol phosphate export permease